MTGFNSKEIIIIIRFVNEGVSLLKEKTRQKKLINFNYIKFQKICTIILLFFSKFQKELLNEFLNLNITLKIVSQLKRNVRNISSKKGIIFKRWHMQAKPKERMRKKT